MRRILYIGMLALAVLTACSSNQSAPTQVIPTVSLAAAKPAGKGTASAIVVPVQKVELSFPMTGIIKTVDVKEGDTVKAGQKLASLDTTILEARVAEAQANLEVMTTQYRYLKRVGSAQENIDAAAANIDQAQAAVDSAKATLAQATLTAPFDGTVASIQLSSSETAVAGQSVISFGDLSNMQIETTDLSERDVAAVQQGQTATVFIEALNDRFPGKVTSVARVSTTVGGDVVYKVVIQLDHQPEGLRWGMSADVEIQTGP